MKTFYRQKLPHIQEPGQIFFVTFCLNGAISKKQIDILKYKFLLKDEELQNIKDDFEKKVSRTKNRTLYFKEMDDLLDKVNEGPHYLKSDKIAQIVFDSVLAFDNKYYSLLAMCIMSNHVHILLNTSIQIQELDYDERRLEKEYKNLDQIMKLIKGRSARFANLELKRSGTFWEKENFDIYIRNQRMMKNVIKYILENPVKAGLVSDFKDYKWNYWLHEENI